MEISIDLVKPDGEKFSFNYDVGPDNPITIDMIKAVLQHRFNIRNFMDLSFYHKKKLITRTTKLCSPDTDDEKCQTLTIALMNKGVYPDRAFPRADFELPVDVGILNPNPSFFPPIEGPKYYHHAGHAVTSLVEEQMEQAASFPSVFSAIQNLENFELRANQIQEAQNNMGASNGNLNGLRNPRNRRLHLFDPRSHPEEEQQPEDNGDRSDGEYEEEITEDIDEIMEMKECYEENMTEEQQASVDKLVALGFDKNLVTPLLFMLGDEEKTMQFLQKSIDETRGNQDEGIF
ncbi:hypothetical protein TRFO_04883 [Tritrichomonas foetus]|uniref:UBA domain-containing protein n=1 Tax=Tritrichomonas foetus TaxID=1144522 RepID=A0A1J4KA07_9EUKA|nr:hypothetical protein TRFO_04883 [Tritrichomonas foetus]|eukprot:OHT08281.1 hypothetical protein TRFO_04883 [Tritrichomonas foetus]